MPNGFLVCIFNLRGWYHRASKHLNVRFSYIREDKQQWTSPPYVSLSPHCLSLEWVSAEHSHQVGCWDTQTTGIAIIVVLYGTAKGASLMGRWMPGKDAPCQHTSLHFTRAAKIRDLLTEPALGPGLADLLANCKILGSHVTLLNLKHLHNGAGKGCLWVFKNCYRIWLTLHSWQRGAVWCMCFQYA